MTADDLLHLYYSPAVQPVFLWKLPFQKKIIRRHKLLLPELFPSGRLKTANPPLWKNSFRNHSFFPAVPDLHSYRTKRPHLASLPDFLHKPVVREDTAPIDSSFGKLRESVLTKEKLLLNSAVSLGTPPPEPDFGGIFHELERRLAIELGAG